MGVIITLLARLLLPFSIFRYPLAGGLACMALDAVDIIVIYFIGDAHFPAAQQFYDSYYAETDKVLDLYYLAFELRISLKWTEQLARSASIWLFAWRIAGVTLFEVTRIRWILFWAPNLFENFYLFYLIAKKVKPSFQIESKKRLLVILLFLYIPKFFQEYILHVRQAQPTEWIRANFFPWLPKR